MSENAISKEDLKKFFMAATDGDVAQLRAMLEQGVPVDVEDQDSRVALFVAAGYGRVDCINLLLDCGARINRKVPRGTQNMGKSALDNALIRSQVHAAKLLLERGADPRLLDDEQNTAAHIILGRITGTPAAGKPDQNPEWEQLLELALNSKNPPNQLNKDGENLIFIAVHRSKPTSTIETLLRHGCDPRIMNFEGRTAIHRDWDERVLPTLSCLAENNVDLEVRDFRGFTPLFYVKDLPAAKQFCSLGVNINAVDNVGRNALAARLESSNWLGKSDVELFTFLIGEGLDMETPDYSGESPLDSLKQRSDDGSKVLLGAAMAKKARSVMQGYIDTPKSAKKPH